MSKRGEAFERSPRDLYETVDPRAVAALLPYVDKSMPFVEPCAGAGALTDQLLAAGMACAGELDIQPLRPHIAMLDARAVRLNAGEQVITNPPFTRKLMHEIMLHCARQVPSWFLVEADWLFTQQATPILTKHGAQAVAIGRLKWFREDDPRQKGNDPMDNMAWLQLVPEPFGGMIFWPRA